MLALSFVAPIKFENNETHLWHRPDQDALLCVHWESYFLLQDLKKEKKNCFCEITCDFSLDPGSAPLPVVKSGR